MHMTCHDMDMTCAYTCACYMCRQGAAPPRLGVDVRLGGHTLDQQVRLVLIEPGVPGGLRLAATSAKPECGFCRFMKNGPCGKEFEAWEAR